MHIRGPIFFAGPRVAAFDSPIPPTVRSRFPERRPPPAMFESLGEKFDSLLRKLRGQGKITERNIEEALRDVRLALLEADVNLNVVRDFVEAVKRDALGAEVLRSLTPEQHFVKFVHREGVAAARARGLDTVLIDTAGRQTVDDELMRELERMVAAVTPHQVLLVADAMTGQDAVATAEGFARRLPVSGVVLTKIEGDARGGAALSLRAVTGKPIVFAGTGEKLDALEPFYPDRIASRILGMGDVLSLVERAEKAYDRSQAEALQKKLRRNAFDLEDFREQLRAVKKMGAVSELLGMIPGMKKMLRGTDLSGAEDELKRVEAIIDSMTRAERKNIQLLNASRRKRIARGSGTSVADVNRLIKQFTHTKKVLKQLGSGATGPRIPGLPGLPR